MGTEPAEVGAHDCTCGILPDEYGFMRKRFVFPGYPADILPSLEHWAAVTPGASARFVAFDADRCESILEIAIAADAARHVRAA